MDGKPVALIHELLDPKKLQITQNLTDLFPPHFVSICLPSYVTFYCSQTVSVPTSISLVSYLQDVLSRVDVCDIDPLAVYISIVCVVAAWAQTLKRGGQILIRNKSKTVAILSQQSKNIKNKHEEANENPAVNAKTSKKSYESVTYNPS